MCDTYSITYTHLGGGAVVALKECEHGTVSLYHIVWAEISTCMSVARVAPETLCEW